MIFSMFLAWDKYIYLIWFDLIVEKNRLMSLELLKNYRFYVILGLNSDSLQLIQMILFFSRFNFSIKFEFNSKMIVKVSITLITPIYFF